MGESESKTDRRGDEPRGDEAAAAAEDRYGLEDAFLLAARQGRMSWGSSVEDWAHVEVQMPDIFDRVIFENEPIPQVTADIAQRIDEILASSGSGG